MIPYKIAGYGGDKRDYARHDGVYITEAGEQIEDAEVNNCADNSNNSESQKAGAFLRTGEYRRCHLESQFFLEIGYGASDALIQVDFCFPAEDILCPCYVGATTLGVARAAPGGDEGDSAWVARCAIDRLSKLKNGDFI